MPEPDYLKILQEDGEALEPTRCERMKAHNEFCRRVREEGLDSFPKTPISFLKKAIDRIFNA